MGYSLPMAINPNDRRAMKAQRSIYRMERQQRGGTFFGDLFGCFGCLFKLLIVLVIIGAASYVFAELFLFNPKPAPPPACVSATGQTCQLSTTSPGGN